MRIFLPVAAGLALAGTAAPAAAQDIRADGDIAALTDRLSDPALQQELAVTFAALSQVLLDLPIAPLAEAAADIAGETAQDIDPDMTIRKALPEASDVPEVIERELPQAMDRMASLSGAMQAMLPALRDAARQMEGAIEGARIR